MKLLLSVTFDLHDISLNRLENSQFSLIRNQAALSGCQWIVFPKIYLFLIMWKIHVNKMINREGGDFDISLGIECGTEYTPNERCRSSYWHLSPYR